MDHKSYLCRVPASQLAPEPHSEGRRIVLPSFGRGKLIQEVLINSSEEVFGEVLLIAYADARYKIDQLAQTLFIQRRPGIVFGQDAFEGAVISPDGDHGIVHELAYSGLLGVSL